jgi:hypothetical protein
LEDTQMATRRSAPKAIVDDGPKKPKTVGVTSGVMAPGKVGRAAREAAHMLYGGGTPPAQTPDRPRDR